MVKILGLILSAALCIAIQPVAAASEGTQVVEQPRGVAHANVLGG
jgi:hypothetical protein